MWRKVYGISIYFRANVQDISEGSVLFYLKQQGNALSRVKPMIVLFIGNYRSHFGADVSETLSKPRVKMIVFWSHASWLLQMFDLLFFGCMKREKEIATTGEIWIHWSIILDANIAPSSERGQQRMPVNKHCGRIWTRESKWIDCVNLKWGKSKILVQLQRSRIETFRSASDHVAENSVSNAF
jgi:hypothetical protein